MAKIECIMLMPYKGLGLTLKIYVFLNYVKDWRISAFVATPFFFRSTRDLLLVLKSVKIGVIPGKREFLEKFLKREKPSIYWAFEHFSRSGRDSNPRPPA